MCLIASCIATATALSTSSVDAFSPSLGISVFSTLANSSSLTLASASPRCLTKLSLRPLNILPLATAYDIVLHIQPTPLGIRLNTPSATAGGIRATLANLAPCIAIQCLELNLAPWFNTCLADNIYSSCCDINPC